MRFSTGREISGKFSKLPPLIMIKARIERREANEVYICDFCCSIGCIYVSELFVVVDIAFVIIDIIQDL